MISRTPRAAAELRSDEHLIAPHDRRRYAEAADGRFPRDVLRVAPPLRQGGFPRHTSGRRPSPMGPVLGVCRGERHHDGEGEQEVSHDVLGDIIVRDAQSVKQDSCFTQRFIFVAATRLVNSRMQRTVFLNMRIAYGIAAVLVALPLLARAFCAGARVRPLLAAVAWSARQWDLPHC